MTIPKISIITPSFNQGLYLEDCIKSVLDQGYPNLEFILLDGGSTDLSRFIIKKYEKHFTYCRSEKDAGQYAAINEGINRATGEIIAWLNSDDMLHPGALWQIANAYAADKEALWFTGIPSTWNTFGELTYINPDPPDWSYQYLLNITKSLPIIFLQQESTFFTKKLWDMAGGKLDTRYQLAADFELWLRFSRYSEVMKLDTLIGGFRQHQEQKTAKAYALYMEEVGQILEVESRVSIDGLTLPRSSSKVQAPPVHIATSIAPKDLVNQRKAIASWLDNGFTVHSFNSADEVQRLRDVYENVIFHEVEETALAITGKPLVFLRDIFNHFHALGTPFTLINSDIHFSVGRGFASRLSQHLDCAEPTAILASRVEIENEFLQLKPEDPYNAICRLKYGRHYFMGFDLFSFNRAALDVIAPAIEKSGRTYGLGIPWWDYWLPMTALSQGVKLNYLVPTPIFHNYHEAQYSKDMWRDYGEKFSMSIGLFGPGGSATDLRAAGRLDDYLSHLCGQVIRCLGQSFIELDLGTYLRVPRGSMFSDLSDEFITHERFHFAWKDRIEMMQDELKDRDFECQNMEHAIMAKAPILGR